MSQMSHVEELRTWFEAKVTENYRLFYSIATSVLKSSHEAEEAVQEAVLKAWRSLDSLEDPAALVGWVARITRNVALDLKKKRQPTPVDWTDIDANASRESQDSVTPDPDRHDDRAYLLKLIGELPDSQSVVVTLRFMEDMDIEQIGKRLGLTPNAVRVRLHRGLETLRRDPRSWQMAADRP